MKPNPALERAILVAVRTRIQYPLDWHELGKTHGEHRRVVLAQYQRLVDSGAIEEIPPMPRLLRLTKKGEERLAELERSA